MKKNEIKRKKRNQTDSNLDKWLRAQEKCVSINCLFVRQPLSDFTVKCADRRINVNLYTGNITNALKRPKKKHTH